jgi:hypothetical protein
MRVDANSWDNWTTIRRVMSGELVNIKSLKASTSPSLKLITIRTMSRGEKGNSSIEQVFHSLKKPPQKNLFE